MIIKKIKEIQKIFSLKIIFHSFFRWRIFVFFAADELILLK